MLGGEAPADAPAAPAALADAVFQPRPAGDPHAEAVVQQRRMLVGSQGADATHQWLEARGIAAAPNSGATSMDCLIISLLQHATNRYDAASEPALPARRPGIAPHWPCSIRRSCRVTGCSTPTSRPPAR